LQENVAPVIAAVELAAVPPVHVFANLAAKLLHVIDAS
jgi:hypothetical protein